MPLIVLSDADVIEILGTITKNDLLELHSALANALHEYSTATSGQVNGCAAVNQPQRIALVNKDGGTTLFMPASSNTALGVKIVTLSETPGETASSSAALPDVGSMSLSSESSSDIISKHSSSRNSSTSAGASISPATSRNSSISFRSSSPSTSGSKFSSGTSHSSGSGKDPTKVQQQDARIIAPGTRIDSLSPGTTSPRGSITLLSSTGEPRALINASTLTAFRTALVSTMLLRHRASVHTITIFGAGLQAFWHLFVAILLRGDEIHHINIINRDFTRAQRLIMGLGQSQNEAVADVIMGTKCQPTILTPEYGEYARLLKKHVRDADVIFCTTPATAPLFPASHLTSTEARRKARYIAAIGSYKPHMQELHEDILRQAVRPQTDDNKHGLHVRHRYAAEGGAVIVDSIEAAMKEAGEIIKAGISATSIVEIGELVMLRRGHRAELEQHERRDQNSTSSNPKDQHNSHHGLGHVFHHHQQTDQEKERRQRQKEVDGGLMDWLQRGNVIYKGVGIGLMDVVVGMEIVRLAGARGIGTLIEDF